MSLLDKLVDKECIKTGFFKLKNGKLSKYYIDMKHLISHPTLLSEVGDALYKLIDLNNCDLICGVPLGGLPIATYISTKYNIPMIIPRDKAKDYGMCKQIEGNYKKENKCVIIEDVITTGGSVENIIRLLKNKVTITNIIVIVNRGNESDLSFSVTSLFNKIDLRKITND